MKDLNDLLGDDEEMKHLLQPGQKKELCQGLCRLLYWYYGEDGNRARELKISKGVKQTGIELRALEAIRNYVAPGKLNFLFYLLEFPISTDLFSYNFYR